MTQLVENKCMIRELGHFQKAHVLLKTCMGKPLDMPNQLNVIEFSTQKNTHACRDAQ
jgi:hypothetical protein